MTFKSKSSSGFLLIFFLLMVLNFLNHSKTKGKKKTKSLFRTVIMYIIGMSPKIIGTREEKMKIMYQK
jgi:hypothetical protein